MKLGVDFYQKLRYTVCMVETENSMARQFTARMLDLLEEEMFNKDILILELLNYMSEQEVKNFVEEQDFVGFKDLGFTSTYDETDEE